MEQYYDIYFCYHLVGSLSMVCVWVMFPDAFKAGRKRAPSPGGLGVISLNNSGV